MITKTITESVGDAYHTTEYTFNNVQELIDFETGKEDGSYTENTGDSKDIKIGSVCKVVGYHSKCGLEYGTLVLILNNVDSSGYFYVRRLGENCSTYFVKGDEIELITNDIVGMI